MFFGGDCSPCCSGCNEGIALNAWKKLCASRIRVTLTGSIPASHEAANVENLVQSRYFPESRSLIDGKIRQPGWYDLTQIAGAGKANASDYSLNAVGMFYQAKAAIALGEFVLEPDLRPGGIHADAKDYTSSATYSVRFVGGDELLSIVLAVRISTASASDENALTGTKCATTARLYVTSKRRYKMETNLGQRIGTSAAVYEFPFDNGLGGLPYTPAYTTDIRGLASIAEAPTAYRTGRLALSSDGTNTPPTPSGESWYESLSENNAVPWVQMLESYTEIPLSAFAVSGEPQQTTYARVPYQWSDNPGAGGAVEWVSAYFINTQFEYVIRSAFGTITGTRTTYGIFLDGAQGFATRSQKAYVPAPGTWGLAPTIPALPRGAAPANPGPLLPGVVSGVDPAKKIGVASGLAEAKEHPIPATGIPLAVIPEVEAGSYFTGTKVPVRLKFPNRPDIYAPTVVTSGTAQPTPVMVVSFGGANEQADYVSGSGTTTLHFEYTVRNHITTQQTRLGNLLSPNGSWGGSGLSGVWAMFMYWPDQVLDANLSTFTIPIQGVSLNPTPQAIITAGLPVPPSTRRTLRPGEIVELTIAYLAAVVVTGTPTVNIRVGATRQMNLASHTGNQLVFRYTIRPNDYEMSGIFFSSSIDNCTIHYASGGEAIRVFDSPIYVQERGAMLASSI